MKKLISSLFLFASSVAFAQAPENITVMFSAAASQPNSAPYLRMVEVANQIQDKYRFLFEFKPGANGVIAIRNMDLSPENRLATVAPAFVENAKSGAINKNDYVAVASQGEACWAIITNVGDTARGIESLRGQKEILVGGTGFGNAAHITALTIGEKYGFKVRYAVYKANYDALVNMASGEPVNFVLERVANYQIFKTKNPKLQILGINCNKRSDLMPEVKTVKEQGFNTPTIFMATVANVKMPEAKRKEIAEILEAAQEKVGAKYLSDTADMSPPQFAKPKQSASDFFNARVKQMEELTVKYEAQIEAGKQ
jgi:tripartite-type tricarboxylate transporter receptor subunit TctC